MGHLTLENSILFPSACGERIATGKGKAEIYPKIGHGELS
jgi:hypothetical protein